MRGHCFGKMQEIRAIESDMRYEAWAPAANQDAVDIVKDLKGTLARLEIPFDKA